LDQKTEQLVRDLVRGKVTNQEAFTAFDITKAVRDALNTLAQAAGQTRPMVSHDDVRVLVHSYVQGQIDDEDADFDGYQYESQTVDAGRGVSAIVYFHDSNTTYSSQFASVPTTVTLSGNSGSGDSLRSAPHVGGYNPAPAPASTPSPSAPAAKRTSPYNGDGPKPLDEKLRLRVPANLLRAAGFKTGDEVEVYFHDGEQSIVVTSPLGAQPTLYAVYGLGNWVNAKSLGTHTVDQYGNIRIGLKSKGVKTGLKFNLNQLASSKGNGVIATPA
jgi:bifunctional DNA-binding transcriptional regulator/antitoxin component of YhaV-PrlF toxin-antitoxin module